MLLTLIAGGRGGMIIGGRTRMGAGLGGYTSGGFTQMGGGHGTCTGGGRTHIGFGCGGCTCEKLELLFCVVGEGVQLMQFKCEL